MGRDGQRFSHAPQPMHFTASTTGTPFTSTMAFTGQCRSHVVQVTPFRDATHLSLCHIARPTWVCSFSSRETLTIAPAGQTSAQREHAGRQYPCSNPISGNRKRFGSREGRNTFSGHTFTHSWQATHFRRNAASPAAPAGRTGVFLSGTPGFETGAKPPSTSLPAATAAAPDSRKPLRVISLCICGTPRNVRTCRTCP